MKNILIICFVISFVQVSKAQNIADHAIGIRLGENKGYGTEITYQGGLGNNRVEIDFGLSRSIQNRTVSYRLTGLYQWVFPIRNISLNWYLGLGGGAGNWRYEPSHPLSAVTKSQNFIFAAGDIGIESDFGTRLQVSLDYRPQLGLVNYGNNSIYDVAISVRYRIE